MIDLEKQQKEPIKMILYVTQLYKKYKVLNKLSDKQSKQFQSQIVTLLVDTNQNVHLESYNQIIRSIGLSSFILEILSTVINRNPFKNQFQFNQNISLIQEDLQRKQIQIQKKMKVLERKEESIKELENNLIAQVKEKAVCIEKQINVKLNKKEAEMKKTISNLVNQLKAKQKIVTDKLQILKTNQKVLAQIQAKEKQINQKLRLIERRQKESKVKELQAINIQKSLQIESLKSTNDRLNETIKQLNRKLKNLDLAYRKIKNHQKKLQFEFKQSIAKDKEQVQRISFDDLELSKIIVASSPKQEQTDEEADQKQIKKLRRIIHQILKQQNKMIQKNIYSYHQICKWRQQSKNQQESNKILSESLSQESFEFNQSCEIDECQQLLNRVKLIQIHGQGDKLLVIDENKLPLLISECQNLKYPPSIVKQILTLVLEIIEEGQHYDQIIKVLSQKFIVEFLQQAYLLNESNDEITEAATLIMSRIKIYLKASIVLNPSFLKAIQIRLKVERRGSFLFGNIESLLK